MKAAAKKGKATKPAAKSTQRRGRGRPPLVENHPKRDDVLRAVLVPKPNYSAISRTFGISIDALRTFRKANITEPTRRALDEIAQVQAELPVAALDVVAKLQLLSDRGYKMLESIDAWLEDPNAPGKYNLNPRSHEVEVIYEEEVPAGDGKTRICRRTEKLSVLLKKVEGELGVGVLSWEAKTADPRKLLFDAVATLKPLCELIGKATGQLRNDPAVTLNVFLETKEWAQVEAALVEAISPWPPALEAAGKAMARLGGET